MPTLAEAFETAARMDGPLSARLEHYAAALQAIEPRLAAAYDAFVLRLKAAEAGSTTPGPGDELPDLVLPDEAGHLVSTGDLCRHGPLVISFNRGHWCSFCRLELRALSAIEAAVTKAGATMVAITPELAGCTRELRTRTGFSGRVLADADLAASLGLGLAIAVGEPLASMLKSLGVDLGGYQGNDGSLLPIPATFVLAKGGRILARHVDADFRRRMEPADVLAALGS